MGVTKIEAQLQQMLWGEHGPIKHTIATPIVVRGSSSGGVGAAGAQTVPGPQTRRVIRWCKCGRCGKRSRGHKGVTYGEGSPVTRGGSGPLHCFSPCVVPSRTIAYPWCRPWTIILLCVIVWKAPTVMISRQCIELTLVVNLTLC